MKKYLVALLVLIGLGVILFKFGPPVKATFEPAPLGRATPPSSLAAAVVPTLALTATPLNGLAPLTVTFVATCQLCRVYTWDFGDNSGPVVIPGPNQTHTYTAAGVYYPIVVGATSSGAPLNGQVVITVVEDVAAVDVTIASRNHIAKEGDWITFAFAQSSSQGKVISQIFNCGIPGGSAVGQKPAGDDWTYPLSGTFPKGMACLYSQSGSYTASIKVADSLGKQATDTITFTATGR